MSDEPKTLDVRIAELESAVKKLTEAGAPGGQGMTAGAVCQVCVCSTCHVCYSCHVCTTCWNCRICRPICNECICGPGPQF